MLAVSIKLHRVLREEASSQKFFSSFSCVGNIQGRVVSCPTHANQDDDQRSWSGSGTVKQRLEGSIKFPVRSE